MPDGYKVFDVEFYQKPSEITQEFRSFWGGYRLEFKLIEKAKWEKLGGNLEQARKEAVSTSPNQRKRFRVDISKYEYCEGKVEKDIEGFTVYVYSVDMIVAEKLRAICQQKDEYREILMSHTPAPHARDFVDIYHLMEKFSVNICSDDSKEILRCMFEIKRVPLCLLGRIHEDREFHRQDFERVKTTVWPSIELKDFDFYFDYIVEKVKPLEALWKV